MIAKNAQRIRKNTREEEYLHSHGFETPPSIRLRRLAGDAQLSRAEEEYRDILTLERDHEAMAASAQALISLQFFTQPQPQKVRHVGSRSYPHPQLDLAPHSLLSHRLMPLP